MSDPAGEVAARRVARRDRPPIAQCVSARETSVRGSLLCLGDPTITNRSTVDGQTYQIATNLASALRYTPKPTELRSV
jgi:hypothetical protein